jgi:hypothetical protein
VLALESRFVAALSNRAAAHLALDQHGLCVADCTLALQLLSFGTAAAHIPATAGIDIVAPIASARHTAFVTTTLVRRGTALCQLGDLHGAIDDYAAAVRLDPSNTPVALDLKRLRLRLSSTSLSVCETAVAPPSDALAFDTGLVVVDAK